MLIKISAVATGASECTDGESARILACLHWVLTEKRVVAVNTCVKSNNLPAKGLELALELEYQVLRNAWLHETNAYAPIAILAKRSFHFS